MLEIDRTATGLANVHNSEDYIPTFDFDIESHPAIFRFERCFLDLRQILCRASEHPKQKSRSASPQTPAETLPPETHSTPLQKLHGNDMVDSPASTFFNRSAKAEHYTHIFVNNHSSLLKKTSK